MNQFIKIGEKVYSVEDICKLLDIEPKEGTRIALGETSPAELWKHPSSWAALAIT